MQQNQQRCQAQCSRSGHTSLGTRCILASQLLVAVLRRAGASQPRAQLICCAGPRALTRAGWHGGGKPRNLQNWPFLQRISGGRKIRLGPPPTRAVVVEAGETWVISLSVQISIIGSCVLCTFDCLCSYISLSPQDMRSGSSHSY